MRSGQIKILNANDKLSEVINSVKLYDGITDVTVNNDILSYYIDEWASDYDIMVAVMNALEDAGIDCEPYFDDDITNSTTEVTNVVEDSIENEDNEEEHDHDDDDEDGCCGHNHYHKEGFLKANKVKLIELSIAIIILIVGAIFGAIDKVKVASPYICIVAFSVAGYEVFFEAFMQIFKKNFFNEQILMTLAAIAAIALGEVVEAAGIIILYNVGELFEDGAISNSRKVIENLKSMRPDTVTIINDAGEEVKVKPETVAVGTTVICRAGEKIAIDGKVMEGTADLDTKVITGESVYKAVEVGSEVYGGFINIDGVIKIKTTEVYANSAVSKISEIVESANKNKSKAEKFTTKFAKFYTPIVMIVAILLAFIPPFFYETYAVGLSVWLHRAVMMLCVACPCAIVISVPLAYFCATGSAASNGVLIKSSAHFEKLANCKAVAFDKTGTLTTGKFSVSKIISTKKFQGKVLHYCAIAEKNSTHPIAKAILEKYGKAVEENAENHREIAGRGVAVTYNNEEILCGNAKLLQENNVEFKEVTELGAKLYLSVNGEFAGVIVLNDTVRDTAYGSIMELYDAGVQNTIMLTGDNKEYAKLIRKELNMRQSVSELLPEDKVTELERIISETENGTVAFVGDGINDAPVLARADVGIAMGGLGSDVAIESADIVLHSDDLSKIPYAVKLAKRTKSIVKQNVIVSILIKLLVIGLSVAGITTNLWLAIGADVGVMILAILNSIRNRTKIL